MTTYIVSSGVISTGVTLGVGDFLYVSSGGIASSTVVSSGGSETVSTGGSAVSTTVSSGGFEDSLRRHGQPPRWAAAAPKTVVRRHGQLHHGEQTAATRGCDGTTVSHRAQRRNNHVSGGTAIGTTVRQRGSALEFATGGAASFTTVSRRTDDVSRRHGHQHHVAQRRHRTR